jgi:hypothetical protein
MPSMPNSEVEPEFVASDVAKPERILAGFPWVSAIILYTLSWGWSLLRPNTLYWDDWDSYFNQPLNNTWKVFVSYGRPPWGGVIEYFLVHIGVWTIQFSSFVGFFISGVCFYGILKSVPLINVPMRKSLTVLFLVLPVNHARISIVVFDYSTSYFLFFLAWIILIRYTSFKGFSLAILLFFLSLKTHSLVFFIFLPSLHFWLLQFSDKEMTNRRLSIWKGILIISSPIVYYLLRKNFWPPLEKWGPEQNQVMTSQGIKTGVLPLIISGFLLSFIFIRRNNRRNSPGYLALAVGFFCLSIALFPYFATERYGVYQGRPAYLNVFEFRADWRSRHQLLMPFGLALSVVGLNELLKWRGKNIVVSTVLVISVALNMFWGSQYFLMSHKQEQLVELFKTTKDKVKVASVEDQTKRFNGRESTFRSYEWTGFMTLAGISTDRPGCEALPLGSALTLKSDTSYLQALATRDLGLYFEIKPCSEVLAQNN